MAVTASARRRAREDLIRVVNRGAGAQQLVPAVTRALHPVVPSDGACLLTFDPATWLPTGEIVENGLPRGAMPRMAEIEMFEPDVNKMTELARRARPAASLSEATGGDLDRSLRQREVRAPSGFGDELRVALVDGTSTWGGLTLLRHTERPHFTAAEVRFVASLSSILADGLRRSVVASTGGDDDLSGPGLLVLAPDGSVELENRSAGHWLDALMVDGSVVGDLPVVVVAVARRALRSAADEPPGGTDAEPPTLARARVATRTGRWLVVRGSALGEGRVAVQLEPARAPDLAPLIVEAYGFTDRERTITELVAQGLPTNDIAERLHLSAYTVQDHLKSIFEKSDTGSRGELVARLFVDHFAPR